MGACVLALAAALPAAAQDWAKANLAKSPRHGEYVTLTEASGRKVQAWVVYPEIKEKAPVVVMVHEIFGLSDWAREMADEVAGAGYIVVEPDLLSGYGPAAHGQLYGNHPPHMVPACDPMNCDENGKPAVAKVMPDGSIRIVPAARTQTAVDTIDPAIFRLSSAAPQLLTAAYGSQQPADHSHMAANNGQAFVPMQPGGTAAFPDQDSVTRAVSSLPDAGVLADLDAAADFGKKLPAASGKLFVTGFCWGGGKSFLFATHRHDLAAAFPFYGPPPSTDLMKNITTPVYGFYAANDARITSTVPQTETAMKAAGKTYEAKIYEGAGHGFMRAGEAPDASAANSAARQDAFRRLVSLLGGVH